MNETTKVYETSIFPDKEIQHVKDGRPQMSSTAVVVILLICFVLLKLFIYIKDDKRHGK